jgi:hypothetical protein
MAGEHSGAGRSEKDAISANNRARIAMNPQDCREMTEKDR